ncbi:MAG: hypothetical protein ACK4M7_01940 [Burkholderiales bacterium]
MDTLKSLRHLKNRLENKNIDPDQFLFHVREIKKQSEKINALFKPTSEFNYWFRGNNYKADRMSKIIEYLNSILDNVCQIDTVPDEILDKIYQLTKENDKKTEANLALTNHKAYGLIKFYRDKDDFKNITLTNKVIFNEGKFNNFLDYLKYPDCKTEKLNISYLKIENRRLNKLLEALKRNRSVIGLELVHCRINNSNLQKIAQLNRLVMLNISKNLIRDAGAKHIAKSLKNLTHLDIGYNGISADGAEYIAKNLKKLTYLNIEGNWLGAEGNLHITNNLTNLTYLNTNGNMFGVDVAKDIVKGITLLQMGPRPIRWKYIP